MWTSILKKWNDEGYCNFLTKQNKTDKSKETIIWKNKPPDKDSFKQKVDNAWNEEITKNKKKKTKQCTKKIPYFLNIIILSEFYNFPSTLLKYSLTNLVLDELYWPLPWINFQGWWHFQFTIRIIKMNNLLKSEVTLYYF